MNDLIQHARYQHRALSFIRLYYIYVGSQIIRLVVDDLPRGMGYDCPWVSSRFYRRIGIRLKHTPMLLHVKYSKIIGSCSEPKILLAT